MGRAEDLFERIVHGGAARIEQMIKDEETEELFLDYKRSADDGSGTRLHQNDKQTLGRAISGFGNSEGGIVIWGVDCRSSAGRGDVPSKAVSISRPSRFKSWLEDIVSGLTVPPHAGTRHHAVPIEGQDSGFVVTLIPKSDHAPHQTVSDNRYLIRAGSSFSPVPHAVLAGLFGRRPHAKLIHKYTVPPPLKLSHDAVRLEFGILLRNVGPVVAEDLYLNVGIWRFGGSASSVSFDTPNLEFWQAQFNFKQELSVIAQPHRRLAPNASVQPVSIQWTMKPPFTEPLRLDLTYGARGTSVHSFGRDIPKEELYNAWELVARTSQNNSAFNVAVDKFNAIIFGQAPD